MSHDPKAEKAAGIMQTQRERYGTAPDNPTTAPARVPARADSATRNVNGDTSGSTSSGVGAGMKKG